MDKVETKQAWEKAGLPTPPWRRLDSANARALDEIAAPCVVKAISSGSSIDVFVCKTLDEAKARATRSWPTTSRP